MIFARCYPAVTESRQIQDYYQLLYKHLTAFEVFET